VRSRETFWSLARMAVVIVLLHVVGFLLLLDPSWSRSTTTVLGLGLTAYTLGLRHAFDADHIAAIDNTTRKLVGDARSPASVGFWFSLGHSSVVLALTFVLALGARALAGPIGDDSSTLHRVTGIIGTTVSGTFLYAIAGINLFLLIAAVRKLRAVKEGRMSAESVQDAAPAGPLTRLFGRAVRAIRRPWQMYPLGVLFGLGFDTATEIGLLVVAATSAASGISGYALLALPLLFAAGMSLLDTADGLVMRYAYGWAFRKPERRMHYNLTVTALSVCVALIVGSVEFLSLIGERLQLSGAFWTWAGSIDLSTIGLGIAGLLVAVWAAAFAVSVLLRARRRATVLREQ
jgi:nickel/cobalt transporter (NiCoT) family protein